MGKFRELKVWQRAKDLAVYIYRETEKGEFSRDFGLRDQIRRVVVSIASNIAEGDEVDTDKQSARHFYMAKGSSAEVLTQTIIAQKLAAVVCENSDAAKFSELCNLISKHGKAKAKSTLQTVAHLAPNSTKRKFEYVEERLEGKG